MGAITHPIAIVLGVLVACFAGPAAALFVLIRRKAKARQSRRSPIGIALLRGPGHSLREQLDEARNDRTWDLVLLMVVPLLALALFLAPTHLRGLLEETAFAFEDREAVVQAVALFDAASSGFAVCLIVAQHVRQGCEFTATSDRGMRSLPGVRVL